MSKWMIVKNHNGTKFVWRFIDDLDTAMRYPYVAQAIRKHGVDKIMPICMNRRGGYHHHTIDEEDVVAIVESENEPALPICERYVVNDMTKRFGWLSPDVVYYACDYMEHYSAAREIAVEMYGSPDDSRADDLLLSKGWMKIEAGEWIGKWECITDAQILHCEKYGIKCRHDDIVGLEEFHRERDFMLECRNKWKKN